MTILDDKRELSEGIAAWPKEFTADRRRVAAGPRSSWASTQPFLPRSEHSGHMVAESDGDGWSVAAGRYIAGVLCVDVVGSTIVVLTVLVLAHGARGRRGLWPIAVALIFVGLLLAFGAYDRRSIGDGPDEFRAVMRAGIGSVAAVGLTSVAVAWEMPRELVGGTILAIVPTVAVGRYALRRSLHRRRARGEAMSRTLVVGDARSVHGVVTDLQAAPYHGYRIVGVCLPAMKERRSQDAVPILGALADIPQVAFDHHIDVVIVTGSKLAGEALRRLSWALGRSGVALVVAPGLVEVLGPRIQLRPTAGLTLLEVETSSPRSRRLAKAALDRTLGALLLTAALPVIAAAALAVALTSAGAPFYRQRRIGIDGREFTMWKLRSMYEDADARRATLLGQSDRDGLMFKMHDDPRVTPVGRVLRRYSLDELPQLWNVLRGDMSLVGPRPPLPEEVDAYRDAVNRRLRVRPGLTGLWQVSGRADLTWDESVRLDLRYVDNWSVAMDLFILWKTARVVLRGSGAY
jgi:exopolysaccharide biosynthesis polyprenyl glycosylphosphotransferase